MKKMDLLFAVLLVASVGSFFWGYDIGDFTFSQIHNHLYFQAWISLATIILSVLLAGATASIYKFTRLETFRLVPAALLVFSLGMIPIGFHNSYCKVCSDLGFCGTAHNYPDIITIIAIYISTSIYVLSESAIKDVGRALKKLWRALIIALAAIIAVMLVSLFYMQLPEPIPYKSARINPQGIVFLSVSIFSMVAGIVYVLRYRQTGNKALEGVCIQFIVTGLVQLIAAYHIFTCYWCNVEECSEFFVIGGLFILVSMYLLWRSYLPLLSRSLQ